MAKSSSTRDELLGELRLLIKEIDEEGLAFLIRQAHTLIYNMKVDELNERMEETSVETRRKKSGGSGESGGSDEKSDADAGPAVFFEPGKHRGGYILQIESARFIMDEAEVLQLVKIAQSGAGDAEVRKRLYRWIEGNRDDILLDVDLSPRGRRIAALHERLSHDFAVRDE